MRNSISLLLTPLLAIPLLAMCSSNLFAATPAPDCAGPITFGTTISETGAFSSDTEHWSQMTTAFQNAINKDGGVFVKDCNKHIPIKFIVYDDQSSPSTAVSLYQKLITDNHVDFLVGPDWSAIGGPVSGVAESHEIPIVMGNVATRSIYERGYKWVFGTPQPLQPEWSTTYFEMLRHVKPAPKSIFFITEDNPLTQGITSVFSKQATTQGIKVVGEATFEPSTTDFTSIVLHVKATHPDIVYISSFDQVTAPLIRQLRQFGVRAMNIHHTMATERLQQDVGGELNDVTGELSWYPGVKGAFSGMTARILKEADVNPFKDIFTMGRLASYFVMIQAIEDAGSLNRAKVRTALATETFKTPGGAEKFDKDGFPVSSHDFVIQIQKGKVVVVWPKKDATGTLIWPAPGWTAQ